MFGRAGASRFTVGWRSIDPSARETCRNGCTAGRPRYSTGAQSWLTTTRGCPTMPRIILGGSVVPVGDRMWGPGGLSREGTGALPSDGSVHLLSALLVDRRLMRPSDYSDARPSTASSPPPSINSMTVPTIRAGSTAVRNPTTAFTMEFANIRGLHSNLNAVHHHLETARPALLFLTETQICSPTDTSYLMYPGYSLEYSFRPRAGVCLYVRSDVCCRRLRCMEDPSFSTLWVHVDFGSQSRVYVCLYRSHDGDDETTRLFNYISQATDDAQEQFPTAELVVLGDFNAHHELWLGSSRTDHAGRTAHAFALTHGLTQLVNQPTRIPDVASHAPSLLDLLLTSHPTGYKVTVGAPLGTSDHCLVGTSVPRALPSRPVKVKRRVWHYSSADWDGMRDYFASIPWLQRCFEGRDPSASADAIACEIRLGMEYYIPSSELAGKGRGRSWFNRACADAVGKKQAAYRAWIGGRATRDPNVKSLKAAYNRAAKACKREYVRADAQRVTKIGCALANHPTNSRAYWSLAKAVQSNFCRPSLPPLRYQNGTLAHSSQEKADLLAHLFAANSRLEDCNAHLPPTLPGCGHTMPDIRIRHCDVRRELQSLDVRKASGPDGIPALVLKKCAAELSPALTRLYRSSYLSGVVPESWREANVQPIPKKGDRSDPNNYRPIAITSVMCKVMERLINSQLVRYLEDHSLISDRQYGFRHNRSTGDLLAFVLHHWGEAIDRHGEALAVSLDIAKAFDRVWHRGLLSKLPAYGLPDNLCKWISGFLHERRMRVLVDGHASQLMSVNAGVPQGSVLSPTLFLLHINDMLSLGNIHCYADDSTVHGRYCSKPPGCRADTERRREGLVIELNRTLDLISSWGTKNRVEFNAKKTQVCAFSCKKSPFSPIPILQGVPLAMRNDLSVLGMDIRCDLNPRNHIEGVISATSRRVGILNRVRRFFTPGQLYRLYKAQVRPGMEYCSHLWDGSAKYLLDALDGLQRRAIRIVNDADVSNSLEPLQLRRDISALSVFYRLYHGECSEELFDLIPSSPFHARTTRAGLRSHSFVVSTTPARTKRFANSYFCRTIKLWNSLPGTVFPPSYDPGSFRRNVKKLHSRPA